MKPINFQPGSSSEVQKRVILVQELIDKIIHPEERPSFVGDDATIFDICSDDADSLIENIANSYGIRISSQKLKLKIWQLVDLLATKTP
jgi:hypothetical protein